MAKQKVDAALGGQASGTLYADAARRQQERENQYAAAAAAAKSGNANSSSLQGTIDPDRTGSAAPNDVGKAAADSALGSLAGALAGAGGLPKPSGTTAPGGSSKPSGGGSGGSRVTYIDSNGDAAKGTTAPATPTEPQRSYLDELRDQYQKMYDDAVKANNDAAKAAAERALAQVEQGIGELGDQYGSLNKQLYRDYMESLRVLPQEMAARGYNGGMSESARLGLDTAYGERLNENEAARIAAIAQLRQQGADAEYQANAARDQANAQAQQNLYANMVNLLLQQQQDAAARAQNMAQYGDFSGYLDLGYSQSQVDAMKKAWIAANPAMAQALGYASAPRYSSYGGGGGGGITVTTEGLQDAILGDLDGGKDRVAIWNDLAERYRAGDITEEQFQNAIHYTDYAATAKAFNKTPTSAGYKNWPGGNKK